MKSGVVEYVARCLTSQQVNVEHQRPGGMLQSLDILEWKWEEVTMDFVSRLPKSLEGYDSIWIIVDQMTKSTHFLPVKTTDPVRKLEKLYLKEIMRLHGAPSRYFQIAMLGSLQHFGKNCRRILVHD